MKRSSVTVKNPQLCQRYVARMVKNIKIEPSPRWLQGKAARQRRARPNQQYRRHYQLRYAGIWAAHACL